MHPLPAEVIRILGLHKGIESMVIPERLKHDGVRESAAYEVGIIREREDLTKQGLDLQERTIRFTHCTRLTIKMKLGPHGFNDPALKKLLFHLGDPLVRKDCGISPVRECLFEKLVSSRIDYACLRVHHGKLGGHTARSTVSKNEARPVSRRFSYGCKPPTCI